MDIITGITTAISTLKTGYEIKKLAGNLDSEVQQSELRIEIRQLQESLINVQGVLLSAKNEILENRKLIQEKDLEISELKDLKKINEKLVRKQGLYVVVDENGNTVDGAYCPICWETKSKAVHLIFKYGGKRISCFSCKNEFGTETGRTLHAF